MNNIFEMRDKLCQLFNLKIHAPIVKPFIKYLDKMKYKTIKVIYYDK